jgi:hypothetical protein
MVVVVVAVMLHPLEGTSVGVPMDQWKSFGLTVQLVCKQAQVQVVVVPEGYRAVVLALTTVVVLVGFLVLVKAVVWW